MALVLKSNLIHCALHDPMTGETYWPTVPGIIPDPSIPHLYEVTVYSNKVPKPVQYNVWRTILEYFNPFRSTYKSTTCNCVTYITDFLDLKIQGKRPSDVKEELFYQSGAIARARRTTGSA